MPSKKKKAEVFYPVDMNKPKDEALMEIVKLTCPKSKIVDCTNKTGHVSSIVVDDSISFVPVRNNSRRFDVGSNLGYAYGFKGVKVEDCFVYSAHKTVMLTPDLRISINKLQAAMAYIKKMLPRLEERRKEMDTMRQEQKNHELAKTKWIRDATSGMDGELGDYASERYQYGNKGGYNGMLDTRFVLTPEQARKVVDFVVNLRKETVKGGNPDGEVSNT